MIYTVYILYSAEHAKTYTGYTSNLLHRFRSHNLLDKGYTGKYRPWTVVYCDHFKTKAAAAEREKYFKSIAGREKIERSIETDLIEKGYLQIL